MASSPEYTWPEMTFHFEGMPRQVRERMQATGKQFEEVAHDLIPAQIVNPGNTMLLGVTRMDADPVMNYSGLPEESFSVFSAPVRSEGTDSTLVRWSTFVVRATMFDIAVCMVLISTAILSVGKSLTTARAIRNISLYLCAIALDVVAAYVAKGTSADMAVRVLNYVCASMGAVVIFSIVYAHSAVDLVHHALHLTVIYALHRVRSLVSYTWLTIVANISTE